MNKKEDRLRYALIDAMSKHYDHLLERYNKANDYFDSLPEEKKENIYESKQYKAFEGIVRELSQVQGAINTMDIFKCLRGIKEE